MASRRAVGLLSMCALLRLGSGRAGRSLRLVGWNKDRGVPLVPATCVVAASPAYSPCVCSRTRSVCATGAARLWLASSEGEAGSRRISAMRRQCANSPHGGREHACRLALRRGEQHIRNRAPDLGPLAWAAGCSLCKGSTGQDRWRSVNPVRPVFDIHRMNFGSSFTSPISIPSSSTRPWRCGPSQRAEHA